MARAFASWRLGRRKAIAEAHDEESREWLAQLREAMAERERELAAREKQAAEDRKNPPDPRAESVLAAVLADHELWDAVHVRLRPDGNGAYVANQHLLEPREIGVAVGLFFGCSPSTARSRSPGGRRPPAGHAATRRSFRPRVSVTRSSN
jgi:hypothetical protein